MSKSILYADNSATQSVVAAGTTLNFGTIVRRYGCNLKLSGGNVIVNGRGYYSTDVNISYTGTTAGTLDVQLYQDGTPVPGANASMTTAENVVASVTIPARIRESCCCESVLSVVASGVAVNVNNAAIVVEKI